MQTMTNRKKKFSKVEEIPEFTKELKKLSKKYRTLKDDLRRFININLFAYHKKNQDNKGIYEIKGIDSDNPKIYKATKFACISLMGTGSRSGIRVIYAYYEQEDKIELIEIYYKGDKANENKQRIIEYVDRNKIK